MNLRGQGAASPGIPAPQQPALGGEGEALTRVPSASRPAQRAGRRHSPAGTPLRREASRDFPAAFYGAESGSEKRQSLRQIMQRTLPACPPPRVAGAAWTSPSPRTPGGGVCNPRGVLAAQKPGAEAVNELGAGCPATETVQHPQPGHTSGEGGGMARGDPAFHMR